MTERTGKPIRKLRVKRKYQPKTTDDYEVQYAFAGLNVETQKPSSQPTAMNVSVQPRHLDEVALSV